MAFSKMEVIDLTETDSSQIIKENVASTSTIRRTVKASVKRHKKKRSSTMTLENNGLIDLTKENYVESSDEEESTSTFANTFTKEQELSWLHGAIARAREMRCVKFFDTQNAPEPSHVYNLDYISSSEDEMIDEGESSNQIENDFTTMEIEEKSTNSASLNECAKSIDDGSLTGNTPLATEIEENASLSTLSQLHDKDNSSSAIQIDQSIRESTSLSKHDELLNLNSTENSSSLQETAASPETTEDYDFDSLNYDSQTKESTESESSSLSKYFELHGPDSPKNYSQDETDEESSDCSTLTRLLKPIDPYAQCTKDNDKELSSSENQDFQVNQTENEILDLRTTARSAESLEESQPVTENTLYLQENNIVEQANERMKDINSAVDDAISKEMVVDLSRKTNERFYLRKGIRRKKLDTAEIELTNNRTNFSGTITQSCQRQLSPITRAEINESVFSNEPEVLDFSRKTCELERNIETPSENKPENQIPSANPLVDNPALKNRIWNPAQSDVKSSSNTAIQEDETGLNVSPIISEGMISTDTENLVYEIENEVTLLPLKKRKRHSTLNNRAGDDFTPSNIDSHSEDSYSEILPLYNRRVNHKNTDDVAYSPTPRFSIANFQGFGNNINVDKSSYSDPSVKTNHYNMPISLEKPPSAENHQLPDLENPQTQLSEKHHLSHQENHQLHQKKHQELLQQNHKLIHQEKPPLQQPENHQLAHQETPTQLQEKHQLSNQENRQLHLIMYQELLQQKLKLIYQEKPPSQQAENHRLAHQEKPSQLLENHQLSQQINRQLRQEKHQELLQQTPKLIYQEKPPLQAENHRLAHQEKPSQLLENYQLSHQENRQLHREKYHELLQQNPKLIEQEKPPLQQAENHRLAHKAKPPQLLEKHQLSQQINRQLRQETHQELLQQNHQQEPSLPIPENQQENPQLQFPEKHHLPHQEKLQKLQLHQLRSKKKTVLPLPDNHQTQQEERQLQQHQLSHQENLQLLNQQNQQLMHQEQPPLPILVPQFWFSLWQKHQPSQHQIFLEQYQQLSRQNQNSVFSQQQLRVTAYSPQIHEIEGMQNCRGQAIYSCYESFPPYRQLQSNPPQSQMPYLPSYQESFRRNYNQNENLIPTQVVDDAAHRQRILRPATQPTQMATPNPQQFQRSAVPQIETASESARLYETIPTRIFNQFGRY